MEFVCESIPAIIFVLLGLVFGSLSTVLIHRMPTNSLFQQSRSHCPSCDALIPWYLNIPVFSYVALKGKCKTCGTKISIMYPAIEIAGALLFVTAYAAHGLTYQSLSLGVALQLLLVIAVIDAKTQEVSDALNLSALFFAIMSCGIFNLANSLELAAIFAGGMALARFLIAAIIGKEGIGEADIVISATIGVLLGAYNGFYAIMAATVMMMLYCAVFKIKETVAFVPFLFVALLATGFMAIM